MHYIKIYGEKQNSLLYFMVFESKPKNKQKTFDVLKNKINIYKYAKCIPLEKEMHSDMKETKNEMNNEYTFIISNNVLKTMSIMMKYSNGVDTTMRHILYLKLFRLLGM